MTSTLFLTLMLWIAPPADAVQAARSDFEAGNYTSAVMTLTAALADSPDDPALLQYWLGRSYYELHDYEKAVTHAEQSVKLAPQNAEYNRWLGRAYGAKAEQSHSFFTARKVKKAFETAVRLDPDSIPARRDLMQYLAEAPWIVGGSDGQARKQVEAIAKLDPLQGQLARAAYFAANKKWKEAETEYLAVLGEHPKLFEPYMEAAEFFMGRKDAPHLEQSVNAAAQVYPQDPRLGYYRAVTLILQQKEFPTAKRLLQSYIENVPDRSDYPSHRSAMEWLSRTNP